MTTDEALTKLEIRAQEIAGQWNGDSPGLAEDRAHAAIDIIEAVTTIKEALSFLEDN
jgi:hypothetical protein